MPPSFDSRPLVYHSNHQVLSTVRFRRTGLLATSDTCILQSYVSEVSSVDTPTIKTPRGTRRCRSILPAHGGWPRSNFTEIFGVIKRVPGLLCGTVSVILCLAILVKHRRAVRNVTLNYFIPKHRALIRLCYLSSPVLWVISCYCVADVAWSAEDQILRAACLLWEARSWCRQSCRCTACQVQLIFHAQFLPVQCCACVVLAMALCLFTDISHKFGLLSKVWSSVKLAGPIKLVFGIEAFFDLSYTCGLKKFMCLQSWPSCDYHHSGGFRFV